MLAGETLAGLLDEYEQVARRTDELVGTLPDLTFGDGPHACIGAQLAQMEARVVVNVLRDDFPDARLAVPFAELERDLSGMQSRRLATLPT